MYYDEDIGEESNLDQDDLQDDVPSINNSGFLGRSYGNPGEILKTPRQVEDFRAPNNQRPSRFLDVNANRSRADQNPNSGRSNNPFEVMASKQIVFLILLDKQANYSSHNNYQKQQTYGVPEMLSDPRNRSPMGEDSGFREDQEYEQEEPHLDNEFGGSFDYDYKEEL